MAAKKLPVVVWNAYGSRGDVGPCSHQDCLNRAEWVVEFTVNDVDAKTWVCQEHRHNLPAMAEEMVG